MLDAEGMVAVSQAGWIVLCAMMLFSRFVFQAAGPVWMRSFLDTWKDSTTHRVWGIGAFLVGAALGVRAASLWSLLGWIDLCLVLALVLVLCADGLLNLRPSWFGHFKERMQAAWVRRQATPGKADDARLFATVNFFLGFASLLVGIGVYLRRPLNVTWFLASLATALALMTLLLLACGVEEKRRAGRPD